jgi:hypothetical protein
MSQRITINGCYNKVRMPITYIGMNDRWIKAMTAVVLIFVLILVIWGVGIYFGALPSQL